MIPFSWKKTGLSKHFSSKLPCRDKCSLTFAWISRKKGHKIFFVYIFFARLVYYMWRQSLLDNATLDAFSKRELIIYLLLDPLDGCPLGSYHQAHNTIGYSNLHRSLSRSICHQLTKSKGWINIRFSRGTDLREMISCG